MATADDINDAIAENATGPKRVRIGNQEVEQHSIADQLAARDAVANATASTKPHFGLRMTKLIPPGGG